jgi:hypothetical protein
MGTLFASVYNRFLGKITDDMYMVLTPHDTIKDLQNLLIDAIPGFEFPRKVLDYEILMRPINKDTANINGFFVEDAEGNGYEDASYFIVDLSSEEINILATLMLGGWLQRQVTSIENIRMKYSGTDFKMTSQANHLGKLLTLLAEVQRQSKYLQRLYKRRRTGADGTVKSNWSVLREDSVINGYQEIDSLDMKDDTVKTVIFEGGVI